MVQPATSSMPPAPSSRPVFSDTDSDCEIDAPDQELSLADCDPRAAIAAPHADAPLQPSAAPAAPCSPIKGCGTGSDDREQSEKEFLASMEQEALLLKQQMATQERVKARQTAEQGALIQFL